MRFTEDIKHFLTGTNFSNGLTASLEGKNFQKTRMEVIEDLVRNKKVIHVGCADHIPLIKDKIKTNEWLHLRLNKVCEKVVGFDLYDDAIEYIQNLGIDNVFTMDVIHDEIPDAVMNNDWDYLVLGEILEQVDDPVSFLRAIKEKYSGIVDKILITVPNGFMISNFANAFKSKECINTEHRYWFTPFTLSKVLAVSGIEVEDCYISPYSLRNSVIKKAFFKKFPMLNDTLIISANLADKSKEIVAGKG